MINFLICLILSFWVGAIAILSVQNVTPVTLQFLFFRSIELPVGVVLAFSLSIGLLGVAVAQLLWKLTSFQRNSGLTDDDEAWE
jgi:uncharacterized integral membrane protein